MPESLGHKYKIQFFSVVEDSRMGFAEFLAADQSRVKLIDSNSDVFYIKNIDISSTNSAVNCLNKHRSTNFPKVSNIITRKEIDLKLDQNEGLVEKMFFAYNMRTGYVAVQQNSSVCTNTRFPSIVKILMSAGKDIFEPVISERKLTEKDKIVSFHCSVRNFDIDQVNPIDGKEQTILSEMNNIANILRKNESQVISINISQGTGAKHRENCIDSQAVLETVNNSSHISRASARIIATEDDAVEGKFILINLLKNPKVDEIIVEMNGKYPHEQDMIKKLYSCIAE